MKLFGCALLLLGAIIGAGAEERVKRQASYTFPGPRTERAYRQPPAQEAAAGYADEEDYRPQYTPAQARAAPAPVAPATYEQPRAQAPRQQARTQARRASSNSNRANKYGSAPQQSLGNPEEEEEDSGPDPLTLLLQDSQFSCDGKGDGYYADDSVGCQVFHYCVSGAKHSWMCPENTVFHQVHLNCVPDAQDICAQSQKFHFVNDYLYKAIDYEGPNNTARYSQRYYPDGYAVGDDFSTSPRDQGPRRPQPAVQSYPAQAPPRAPVRHQAAPQPAYRAQPAPAPAYRPEPQPPRPAPRPAAEAAYPVEAPPQAYRGVPVEVPPQVYRASAQPQPAPEVYRQSQVAPRPPQASQRGRPQAYRVVPVAPGQSQEHPGHQHSAYASSEEEPQPQARRAAAPRPTAGYAPPRQHYRPVVARSAGYGGSGVQYDEEY